MLRSLRETIGYRIESADGPLGRVRDFFFDDSSWAVRYIVADTGEWLIGRNVLITPQSIGEPDWVNRVFPVCMTREQILDAPGIESHVPITRRYDRRLATFYAWEPNWPMPAGTVAPAIIPPVFFGAEGGDGEKPAPDPHLLDIRDVAGWRIQTGDGEVGRAADFIAQTDAWAIRYLVVDTRRFPPGRKVLISPTWVTKLDWDERRIHVDLSSVEILNSLPFNPSSPVNSHYELRKYDFYGRPAREEHTRPAARLLHLRRGALLRRAS